MASIVSSTMTAYPQVDGRNIVVEVHTDIQGITHQVVYTAPVGADLNANLNDHAIDVGNGLAASEIAANIAAVSVAGSQVTLTIVYSTQADNAAAFFAAYQNLAGTPQGIMLGDYANSLPDATLEALYGITADELAVIRTNTLGPAASAAAAIRASTPPIIPGQ